MTSETLISLCLFALATSATPGPNNAMLFASGVNFGLKRSLPHILGVTLGFTFMQLVLGLGVGMVFEAVPGLYAILRAVGVGYMLYLAWAIGSSTPRDMDGENGGARPMTFLQASAFQWVNPKALMMCITAASTYAPPDRPILGALMVTAAFFFVGMPCVGGWAVLGALMRGLMRDRRKLKAFNVAMASLLALSVAPLAGEMLRDLGVL